MLAVLAAFAFVIGLVINVVNHGSHVTDALLIGLTLLALHFIWSYTPWRHG